MPLIAATPWRRSLPTFLHPDTDLYTLAPFYVDGVERAGGTCVVVPWVATPEAAKEVMQRVDGLLLTGGPDIDPRLYGAENQGSVVPDTVDRRGVTTDSSDFALFRAAMEADKPVLAICRGAQVVNVALGGSMHQHIWGQSTDHPARESTEDPVADADRFLANRHLVTIEPESLLHRCFASQSIDANSMHHQAIDQLGQGLVVTGRSPDGTIEAVEHDSGKVVGVQWHPERLADEGHQVLFDWLIEEAGR